jgi:hypothetical protein
VAHLETSGSGVVVYGGDLLFVPVDQEHPLAQPERVTSVGFVECRPDHRGEVAMAAARTDIRLGEMYRRIARRRGNQKAIVTVSRVICEIAWILVCDPSARFTDLGSGYHDRVNPARQTRSCGAAHRREGRRAPRQHPGQHPGASS